MKLASKKLCLVLAGLTLLLAGCPKTPTRPDPSSTAMGMQPGGRTDSSLNPLDVPMNLEAPGLSAREEGFDANNQNRSALQAQAVYFDFDRSDIKATERSKLQEAKAYLDRNPNYRLLLEGHCDWRGTAEYNLGLGERRANAARAYLTSIGVGADRLETLSKGSLEAVRNGDTAAMARDRRVDLVVVNSSGGMPPF